MDACTFEGDLYLTSNAGDFSADFPAYEAMAKLHHAFFLGLQLMVSANKGPEVVGDWMFRLFRQQHEDKFLSSFEKLGLTDLPHAVACAKYHVLSNGVGGVPVEYMYESDQKAWVRFRYPRWMFDGPTICGMPVSASRGFLNGWYGQNGVSLKNPRLGFVCVSEDVTGEFGLCGYFREYDHDLADDERLQFAKDERPPAFVAADQPQPPPGDWTPERLAKANRNYAVEYVRNGVVQLLNVLPEDEVGSLCAKSGRLIGLQYAQALADDVHAEIDSAQALAAFFRTLLVGMGDDVSEIRDAGFEHSNIRIIKGIDGAARDTLLASWISLFQGMGMSRRALFDVSVQDLGSKLVWQVGQG